MKNTEYDDSPFYRSVTVFAHKLPLGKYKTKQVVVGKKRVSEKKGIFSREEVEVTKDIVESVRVFVPNGEFSETSVDLNRLGSDISEQCNNLCADGYEIMQIISSIEGHFNDKRYEARLGEGAHGPHYIAYGYSLTQGVVILARKKVNRFSGIAPA